MLLLVRNMSPLFVRGVLMARFTSKFGEKAGFCHWLGAFYRMVPNSTALSITTPKNTEICLLQGRKMLQPRYNLTTSKTGCTPFVHRRCYNVTTYIQKTVCKNSKGDASLKPGLIWGQAIRLYNHRQETKNPQESKTQSLADFIK